MGRPKKQASKQINVRLPDLTRAQLDALTAALGMTVTQVLILAIERLAQSELKEKP